MHNQIQDLKGSIRVFCRVRPKLPSEFNKLTCKLTYVDEDSLEITKENVNFISGRSIETPLEFVFNKVFQPECTQLEGFEELSQLIQNAIDGYNVCVFAYGQTGSGKTYTMQGDADQHIGIIPRSIDLVFKLIDKYRKLGWVYQVDVSFLEIYNETVRDLLTTNAKESLEIRYNEGRGTTVTNLTVTPVESATELYYLMKRANQNRAVAVTNYNDHSSRSHADTKITLKGTNPEMGTILTGSLSLVDLAGSESAKKVKRPNMDRDRHLSSAVRHRGKREHLSGSEKRKAAAEKEKKTQEVLAKSRRMTDFFTAPSKQSKAKSDVATTSHSLNDDTASRCASPLQEDDLVSADD
ncbi:hypothetical protein RN001_003881 [Aquatica leii]|uniref:Kinesin-like protein n=1 Tax=Aquatica leii TaxID=1421715 RepID=A0AAN7ST40_9COLE|nr:hypothetical protein RN001_003881 [Aquatica leii]